MLLPNVLDSLFPRRNFLFQLFKPVQHDADLRRRSLRLLDWLEHQEALAVGSHVVVGERSRGRLVLSLKEHPGPADGETRLSGNVHGHHLVAAAVEQLPPVWVPYWLSSTIR